MKNVVTFFKSQSYWQLIAGGFMLCALVELLFTGIGLINPTFSNSVQQGYSWVRMIGWVYLNIGLFLCYFADATGKKIMATIGFFWVCIVSIWVAMLDHCHLFSMCFNDMVYAPFLAISLALMVCIYLYETNRPPFHTASKKDFGLAMRIIFFAWAGSVVFLLVW